MHRPRPRRPRGHLIRRLALVVALAGCADDGPGAVARPTVVEVEAQTCRRPNRIHGVGTVVAIDGDEVLVATAGHTVEGDLRRLTVDGVPATVVALDRRSDLALLAVGLDGAQPADSATAVPGEALLVTTDGERAVTIDRHVTLEVDHATDRATYRRDAVVFAPAVEAGTSGAPLLDASGRLVAVVGATSGDETYAVTFVEVGALLRRPQAHPPDGQPVGACEA